VSPLDPEDLVSAAGRLLPRPAGWLTPAFLGMGLAVLQDIHRADIEDERAKIVAREELRRIRDEALLRLDGREVFAAGAALITGPDGRPEPRQALVVVTEPELVVLSAAPRTPEDEIERIPRGEVTGVRLLDEHGEPVTTPPSEVEEMDMVGRRFLVWLDREIEGRKGGHAFAFLAWSVAAEAERDFRRNLPL
jgi:hypothetical protein